MRGAVCSSCGVLSTERGNGDVGDGGWRDWQHVLVLMSVMVATERVLLVYVVVRMSMLPMLVAVRVRGGKRLCPRRYLLNIKNKPEDGDKEDNAAGDGNDDGDHDGDEDADGAGSVSKDGHANGHEEPEGCCLRG